MSEYHEPPTELSSQTRDLHRAVQTIMEELEAVDWYQQRADVTENDEIKDVLIHHRNEELEHAAMMLEQLRRMDEEVDKQLRAYLFTEDDIVQTEKQKMEKKQANESLLRTLNKSSEQ